MFSVMRSKDSRVATLDLRTASLNPFRELFGRESTLERLRVCESWSGFEIYPLEAQEQAIPACWTSSKWTRRSACLHPPDGAQEVLLSKCLSSHHKSLPSDATWVICSLHLSCCMLDQHLVKQDTNCDASAGESAQSRMKFKRTSDFPLGWCKEAGHEVCSRQEDRN